MNVEMSKQVNKHLQERKEIGELWKDWQEKDRFLALGTETQGRVGKKT